jgi:hypothetical protein
MLCFGKPSIEVVSDFLENQKSADLSYTNVGSTLHANKVALCGNKSFEEYDIDQFRALLGKGESVYKRAVEGIKSWKQFQLDWVDLHYPSTPIAGISLKEVPTISWVEYCHCG